MGRESKANPRSNDYRGPVGPNYTVGFKVIHAPAADWVERNRAAIDAGNPPECPPSDMRIGVMLCLLEIIKSPLKMVPDQTMVRPCAVVFSESMDAFEVNKMTPQQLENMDFDVGADGRIIPRGTPLGHAPPSEEIPRRAAKLYEQPGVTEQLAEGFAGGLPNESPSEEPTEPLRPAPEPEAGEVPR
jgi:hypothetical protein